MLAWILDLLFWAGVGAAIFLLYPQHDCFGPGWHTNAGYLLDDLMVWIKGGDKDE
jgi:hypothetical protein